MKTFIYTTYGVAMWHRPEDLAVSGGLQPWGSRRPRERRARICLARVRRWLGVVVAWSRPRQMNDRVTGAEELGSAAFPGNH